MMDGFEGIGWGMGWWWIIGLIIIVVVAWMVVKLMDQNTRSTQNLGKPAIDILKKRYAKGVIDKQEFEERKKDL